MANQGPSKSPRVVAGLVVIGLVVGAVVAYGLGLHNIPVPQVGTTGSVSKPATELTEASEVIYKRSLEIHERAWASALEKASGDSYHKYAIYATRTIFVKHPEIYLKADMMFLRNMEESKTLEPNVLDLQHYTVVQAKQKYPTNYPLTFSDNRVFTPASTLRKAVREDSFVDQDKITQLERGVLYYYVRSRESGSQEIYLIYCDNENAYVDDAGSLLWMNNLNSVKAVDGNPMLVFNEKYVWYPLMDRDDTRADPELRRLVENFSTSLVSPSLSASDEKTIVVLKAVTEIESPSDEAKALLCSARVSFLQQLSQQDLAQIEEDYQGIHSLDWRTVSLHIMKISNYLSPIAAHLASILELTASNAKDSGLFMVSDEYLSYAGTEPVMAWGNAWIF